MISIRQNVQELEKRDQLRKTTFECLMAAVQDTARYAIDLEEPLTGQFRKHVGALAGETEATEADSLMNCRATFRGLLRDYRDKAAKFIGNLREDLANRARALEEILNGLSSSEGDHQERLRTSMERLRKISESPEAAPIRPALLATAGAIGQSVEDMRKQHGLSMAQFQMEIHMLHQRIDGLERAAMIESGSKLFTKKEMEERIKASPPEWYSLMLIRADGLTEAAARYGDDAGAELVAAFGKRLRNSLPEGVALGRWGPEEFVVKLGATKRDALLASKWVTENLSGVYTCLHEGKIVRPTLRVSVSVAERDPLEPPNRTCARIAEYFAGR